MFLPYDHRLNGNDQLMRYNQAINKRWDIYKYMYVECTEGRLGGREGWGQPRHRFGEIACKVYANVVAIPPVLWMTPFQIKRKKSGLRCF